MHAFFLTIIQLTYRNVSQLQCYSKNINGRQTFLLCLFLLKALSLFQVDASFTERSDGQKVSAQAEFYRLFGSVYLRKDSLTLGPPKT